MAARLDQMAHDGQGDGRSRLIHARRDSRTDAAAAFQHAALGQRGQRPVDRGTRAAELFGQRQFGRYQLTRLIDALADAAHDFGPDAQPAVAARRHRNLGALAVRVINSAIHLTSDRDAVLFASRLRRLERDIIDRASLRH